MTTAVTVSSIPVHDASGPGLGGIEMISPLATVITPRVNTRMENRKAGVSGASQACNDGRERPIPPFPSTHPPARGCR